MVITCCIGPAQRLLLYSEGLRTMCLRFLTVLLLTTMAVPMVTIVQAQSATPSASGLFTNLGLPEITLTATADGLALSSSEVPAGRYLVTLANPAESPTLSIDIVRLVRDDPALCEFRLPPLCFAWYYETYLPGGVSGWTPQAILDFPAGEYGFWGPGELGEEPAAVLTVTGDPDAAIDGPEPQAASIVVTGEEDGNGITLQIDGELKPGPQMFEIHNAADQPIFIVVAQVPGQSTSDQLLASKVDATPVGNTPHFDPFDESEFGRFSLTIAQSPGVTQWVVMDLKPGPVYVAGFLPDPATTDDALFGWYQATAALASVTDQP